MDPTLLPGGEDPLSFLNDAAQWQPWPVLPATAAFAPILPLPRSLAPSARSARAIPAPAPVAATPSQDDDPAAKNHKRVLRNRVNAQLSREKKRRHVEELEDRVRVLETKNRHLERKVDDLQRENSFLQQALHQQHQQPIVSQLVLERQSLSPATSETVDQGAAAHLTPPLSSTPSPFSSSSSSPSNPSPVASMSEPQPDVAMEVEDHPSLIIDSLGQLGQLTQQLHEIPITLAAQGEAFGHPVEGAPPSPPGGELPDLDAILAAADAANPPLEQALPAEQAMMLDPIAQHLQQLTELTNELSGTSPSSLPAHLDPSGEAEGNLQNSLAPSLALAEQIQGLAQTTEQLLQLPNATATAAVQPELDDWDQLEQIQSSPQAESFPWQDMMSLQKNHQAGPLDDFAQLMQTGFQPQPPLQVQFQPQLGPQLHQFQPQPGFQSQSQSQARLQPQSQSQSQPQFQFQFQHQPPLPGAVLTFQKALQDFQVVGDQLQKRVQSPAPDPRSKLLQPASNQPQAMLSFALVVHNQVFQMLQVVATLLVQHFLKARSATPVSSSLAAAQDLYQQPILSF